MQKTSHLLATALAVGSLLLGLALGERLARGGDFSHFSSG